jgi:hypothetical protein
MVDNDLFSGMVTQVAQVTLPGELTQGEPRIEIRVATDGGWLLDAKEQYEHITATIEAENEQNRLAEELRQAQAFHAKIRDVLGLDVVVEPGTHYVVIDGLRFSDGRRYSLTLWQPCTTCGEYNVDGSAIHNTCDVIRNVQHPSDIVCEDCRRKEWRERYKASGTTPAAPEPTPLETLGAALVAYMNSVSEDE